MPLTNSMKQSKRLHIRYASSLFHYLPYMYDMPRSFNCGTYIEHFDSDRNAKRHYRRPYERYFALARLSLHH